MTRFEEEYLRHERDKAFDYLEDKIGAKTIDLRGDVCTYPECKCPFDMGSDYLCLKGKEVVLSKEEKRRWFVTKHGYLLSDNEIQKKWEKRYDD